MSDGRSRSRGADAADLRVGCSGWQYDHWRGDFYPPDLPKRRWFEHYAQTFNTVEINNTFYRLPEASAFDRWREQAPAGFRYAVKFSRFGTHMKKLLDSEQTIPLFLERSERLKSRFGPILVQLPPRWKRNLERLDEFLRNAPRRRRWAIEVREPSWLGEELFQLLRRRKVALCIHDLIDKHPWEVTADWTYIRFHGSKKHSGDYAGAELKAAARRIRPFLHDGLDVYVYFNNDVGGHAIRNALELRDRLEGSRS